MYLISYLKLTGDFGRVGVLTIDKSTSCSFIVGEAILHQPFIRQISNLTLVDDTRYTARA